MASDDHIASIILQEFRLRAADDDGEVARAVASTSAGEDPAIGLLTSVDDQRDVATILGLRDGTSIGSDDARHAALAPYVSRWDQPRRYRARVAERTGVPLVHYRLAVTESGINDADQPLRDGPMEGARSGERTPVGLVWIGLPEGSHAGLLILLGQPTGPGLTPLPHGDWPLALSRHLGVRMYEGPSYS